MIVTRKSNCRFVFKFVENGIVLCAEYCFWSRFNFDFVVNIHKFSGKCTLYTHNRKWKMRSRQRRPVVAPVYECLHDSWSNKIVSLCYIRGTIHLLRYDCLHWVGPLHRAMMIFNGGQFGQQSYSRFDTVNTQKLLLRRIAFFLLFSAVLNSSAIATEHKVNHKLNFGYILPLFHSLAALLFFVVIFLLYEFLHCLYLLIHRFILVFVHVAIVWFIACADVRVCYYFAYQSIKYVVCLSIYTQ